MQIPHDPVAVMVSESKLMPLEISGKAWISVEPKSEELPGDYVTTA